MVARPDSHIYSEFCYGPWACMFDTESQNEQYTWVYFNKKI